jgi:hypothetical protein
VTWEEVEETLKKKDAGRMVFDANNVLARVEKMGDLFEPVRSLKQKLPQLEGLAATSDSGEKSASLAGEAEARPRAGKKTGTATKRTTEKTSKAKTKSTALKSTAGKHRKV